MPSALPSGDPVPMLGPLAELEQAAPGRRPFGLYVHVPFCTTRCGYCDFNTYTAAELGAGASRADYIDSAIDEVRRARRHLGDVDRPVSTVFVGGGTPTLLPASHLNRLLDAVRSEFGLADGAEVTTEANPESVDAESLAALADGGFTRISFGMQSASSRVLRTLDRTHAPGRPQAAVREARDAGFAEISLDLIYGAPGETDGEWQESLDAVVEAGVDHVSAYALIVEEGTALSASIAAGALTAPDDDVLADRYEQADAALSAAGFAWYEVSNWERGGAVCRHNLAYWRSDDWWGIGPGAHSHVGGVRWWNVKHPATYARALREGRWPAAGREVLSDPDRRTEDVLLRIRLAEGLPTVGMAKSLLTELVGDGLVDPGALGRGRLVLTLRGRLLADAVARRLLDHAPEPADV
jgi:oxygen-independent coproporphyrinogen-3 oxidase